MMIVLGTDAHERSHTIVAVDPAGADIGSLTVAATTDGHLCAVPRRGAPNGTSCVVAAGTVRTRSG